MSEIRDLLERATADIDERLDVAAMRRRATTLKRTSSARLAVVAVAVVLVAFVGISRIEFGGSDLPPVRPPQPPVLELDIGELSAGPHRAGRFVSPFRISIPGEGWTANNTFRNWVMLTHGEVAIHFQVWDRVFDPGRDRVGKDDTLPLPEDLARWLAGHPRLDVVTRQTTLLGGRRATRLDLTVTDPVDRQSIECGGSRCVLLGRVRGTGEAADVEEGAIARFVVVPVDQGQLVIHYRAREDVFEGASVAFDELLSTIRFLDR